MRVLVIGEKTSQIKIFANTLCKTVTSTKQAKYIYTYQGFWQSNLGKINFTFLPLSGHITKIDTAKGFGWNECSPIKVVEDSRAIEIKNITKYVTILRKFVENQDEVWFATDPDSEGDNIAYEALQIMKNKIKKNHVIIRRIWNSSLTQKEIIRAFKNPIQWDEKLALAVQGRRLIDAWLGFAATREVTNAARQVAKVNVLSLGRVQLPTLRLIVHRDFEHETFIPSLRFKVIIELETLNYEKFTAEHIKGLLNKEEEADMILDNIKNQESAIILDIVRSRESKIPPIPLNTTAAVALLSKILKVNSKRALDLMIDLYNRGYISYPRTENAMFKPEFPHDEILKQLSGIPALKFFIDTVKDRKNIRNNGKKKEVEDHDPIHPTGEIKGIEKLETQSYQAWNILTKYYISLFMDDFEQAKSVVSILVNQEKFVSKGSEVINLGWLMIQDWIKRNDILLPQLSINDKLKVVNSNKVKSKTTPVARWNDSNLLLEMEKLRIGTKSTRPDIISKLIERKYINRQKNTLISTNWGRALIASLEPIWPEIITPKFTKHVEELMEEVAEGTKVYDEMIDDLRSEYLDYHKILKLKISNYQNLLKKLNLNEQNKASSKVTSEVNKVLLKILETLVDREHKSNFELVKAKYSNKEIHDSINNKYHDAVSDESIDYFIDEISK
jgi:DNA topoisomerase I